MPERNYLMTQAARLAGDLLANDRPTESWRFFDPVYAKSPMGSVMVARLEQYPCFAVADSSTP
jgi:hypothetical protein